MDFKNIRQDYKKHELALTDLSSNPFQLFEKWFKKAEEDANDEFTAFSLATSDKLGKPAVRIVLLKEVKDEKLIFFTNYSSQKGKEMAENPMVSALFFWPKSERQVRFTGIVSKISEKESVDYFNSRPAGSRAGAIASKQSTVINANKDDLIECFEAIKDSDNLQKPKHWGGYSIEISEVEFWQGGMNRLHDRFRYRFQNGDWKIDRLAP